MLSFLSSLKSDIVTELGVVAGGRWGITVLAPNNLVQLIGIHERLAQLEIHPFFQVRGAGKGVVKSYFWVYPNRKIICTRDLLTGARGREPSACHGGTACG